MNSQSIRTLALSALFLFIGCGEAPIIPEANYSLEAIGRSAYKALIKVKKVSQNRREYFSDYLTLEGKLWDPLSNDVRRVTAKVIVLGERRPYTIEIQTIVEERSANEPGYSARFKRVGKSKALIEQLAFRIQDDLRKNKDQSLDDFKPF
ncbi:MAG: hypothetical protein SGJ18_01920 [Pseudomonadota bacterium]|nr:hypothetical protein [Pseudomonadota bacterium]